MFNDFRNLIKVIPVAISVIILSIDSTAQGQAYSIGDHRDNHCDNHCDNQCGDAVPTVTSTTATPMDAVLVNTAPCGDPNCTSCGQGRIGGCLQKGCHSGCDTCGEGCELEIKEEKVKKTCFEIEKKTICIPTVQLPFGFICKPLSARSKTIKVLKTKTYECPTTKYIWSKAEAKPAPACDVVAKPKVETAAPANTDLKIQSPVTQPQTIDATLIAPEPVIQPMPLQQPHQ